MSLYKDASLVMIPSAYKDGKLYSIRPTDGSGDFTFSRGSNLAATRVDVNGLIEKGRENIAKYSNDFSHSVWQKLDNAVVSGQTATDPFGNSNSAWDVVFDGTTNCRIEQSITGVTNGGVYAPSIWARTKSGTQNVRFGSVFTDNFTLTTEWQRLSLYEVEQDSVAYLRLICDDATTLEVYGAQLEQGLVATDYIETTSSTAQAGILEDTPRLDYSGGASCPALLLEPQRTNSISQSEYFDVWTKEDISITSNAATSPQGVQNASKLIPNTALNDHTIYQAISGSGDRSFSVFAKSAGYDFVFVGDNNNNVNDGAIFNLAEGTIALNTSGYNASIESFGDGWYRCSIYGNFSSVYACICPAEDGTTFDFAGDGTSGVYVYGAQWESGSYPTSYIPTYGASVTRSRDECDLNSMSEKGISTNNNWTILLDYKNFRSNQYATYFFAFGGEIMHIYGSSIAYRDTSNVQQYVGDWTLSPYNDGETPFKIAFQYDGVNLTMFHNGVKKSSVANSNLSSRFANNFNRLRIAWHQNNPRQSINQSAFFDTALTDSECIALTTL